MFPKYIIWAIFTHKHFWHPLCGVFSTPTTSSTILCIPILCDTIQPRVNVRFPRFKGSVPQNCPNSDAYPKSRIKPLTIHLLTFNNQIRCLTVLRKVLYFVLLVCFKPFNSEQPLERDAQGEALELGEGEKWSFHTLSTHPILAPSTCVSTWRAF